MSDSRQTSIIMASGLFAPFTKKLACPICCMDVPDHALQIHVSLHPTCAGCKTKFISDFALAIHRATACLSDRRPKDKRRKSTNPAEKPRKKQPQKIAEAKETPAKEGNAKFESGIHSYSMAPSEGDAVDKRPSSDFSGSSNEGSDEELGGGEETESQADADGPMTITNRVQRTRDERERRSVMAQRLCELHEAVYGEESANHSSKDFMKGSTPMARNKLLRGAVQCVGELKNEEQRLIGLKTSEMAKKDALLKLVNRYQKELVLEKDHQVSDDDAAAADESPSPSATTPISPRAAPIPILTAHSLNESTTTSAPIGSLATTPFGTTTTASTARLWEDVANTSTAHSWEVAGKGLDRCDWIINAAPSGSGVRKPDDETAGRADPGDSLGSRGELNVVGNSTPKENDATGAKRDEPPPKAHDSGDDRAGQRRDGLSFAPAIADRVASESADRGTISIGDAGTLGAEGRSISATSSAERPSMPAAETPFESQGETMEADDLIVDVDEVDDAYLEGLNDAELSDGDFS